ncbi:hypothetical protein [Mycolicibacter minnesotensis]
MPPPPGPPVAMPAGGFPAGTGPGRPLPPPWAEQGYLPPPTRRDPRRSRKRLFIAVTSVAAVLVGAVVFGFARHHSQASMTPGEAVRAYLEALSRGDAAAALALSDDEPADKKFLSDAILKKQIAQWPITNIRILSGDNSTLRSAMVHVAVNFGEHISDANLHVKKNAKGAWKLEHAAVQFSILGQSAAAAIKTLTLFGESVDAGAKPYVFPGWVDFGSSNRNLAVQEEPKAFLLDELNGGAYSQPRFELSGPGRAAVGTAVRSALAQCARSSDLRPAHCPQWVIDSTLVDGTAQWTAPADLSSVDFTWLDEAALTTRIRGSAEFGLMVTATSGGQLSGTVHADVHGTADLNRNPPVITFT